MSRVRYFIYRTGVTVVLIWFTLTFLFLLFRAMPGGVESTLIQQGVSQQQAEAILEQWGLNEPLHIQYLQFLKNYATFDVGTSLQYRTPVVEFVWKKVLNSFILIAPGVTVAYVLAAIVGTLMGTNRDGILERYGTVPVVLIGKLPEFFTSMLLIIIFSAHLGWFPPGNMFSTGTATQFTTWWRPYFTLDFLEHYALPFFAVVIWAQAVPTLMMRTSVVEVMGSGFNYYHRITGIPKYTRLKHVGKHSILPLITLYPVVMTRAIGGMVLIEVVFNWPGIGYALVNSVLFRDYPVIQFIFFLVALFVIVSNYLVDIVYGFIDPRISLGES